MRRLASDHDFDSVYSIYMHEEVVPFLGFDPRSRQAFEPVFASLMASRCFYVVEVDSVVEGFYQASRQEGRASHVARLGTLAVSPAEKGSGLAVRMIADAIMDLASQGVSRLELTLEADNPRALGFYKKLGFLHEGTMRAAYKRSHQAHCVDELFLARLLEPLTGGSDAVPVDADQAVAVTKRSVAIEGMTVTRLLPNICTDRMAETRDFYAGLLGFTVRFEHQGWYIQMSSPSNPQLQLGIVRRDHAFTPKAFQQLAQGVGIAVQVEDVDAAHTAATKRGFRVAHQLRNESFGMRRFMVADPNGLLVNIFAFP
jgi:ribosomal protein S18 acetylase RimI-like enzyme/catechol 2,3-dioxygenase-like lactoylglutathione lyase family enzyme